jgi:tyrosine-protein phosphatase YwqE
MDLYGTLERIKAKGYYPVLAHPERYVYMGKKEYRKLKEMNVMFQLNLASLIGGYGKHVRRKAEWLLKKGLYNFIGTDIHSFGICRQLSDMLLVGCQIQLLREIIYNQK